MKKRKTTIAIVVISSVIVGVLMVTFLVLALVSNSNRQLKQAVIIKEGTAKIIGYSDSCNLDGWCGYTLEDVSSREKMRITTGSGLTATYCKVTSKTDNLKKSLSSEMGYGDNKNLAYVGKLVKYQRYKYSCDVYKSYNNSPTGESCQKEGTRIIEWS
jgi:hypothetical protein